MKKMIPILLIAALFVVISGCSSPNRSKNTNDSIAFEYFYRGFTPITEDTDVYAFNSVLGTKVILTEEDWQSFTQKFCPTAGTLSSPDFTKECLVTISSMYGSRASENASIDIESIVVNDGDLLVASGGDISKSIYAINISGVGHWFVNVVKINKNDLPNNVDGIFTSAQLANTNGGVEIIVNSIMPNNSIYITLDNKTDYEYTYGSDFALYEYENNSWETVQPIIDNWGFDDIVYRIAPNSKTDEIFIDWSWLYGDLPGGDYKIQKTVSPIGDPDYFGLYLLEAEFSLPLSTNTEPNKS